MRSIFYYITIFFFTTALFSCGKFLDQKPLHAVVDANAITDQATAEAALGGVYATSENDNWAGAYYDILATKAGFVNFSATDYNFSYTPLVSAGNALWQQFYTTLNAANFAIKGATALDDNKFTTGTSKNAVIAEGRCLRAWVNSNLLWNYCHWWAADDDIYGLLYRDQPIDLSNTQSPRITVGESYKNIYDDLDFAIANLDDFTSSRHVSKQFAQVLKAKLLLYRGGYQNTTADLQTALTLVNDVLTNHPSTFDMESDLAQVYENSWDSKECLFARYLEDDGSRAYTGGYYYTYYLCQISGNTLPLAPGGTLTAGLIYGLDWFSADPRWPIVTGPVRAAETWDNTMRYTFKKLARLGQYAGQQSSDPNAQKYAAYYFRFPELYLMKAELLARTGASIADAIAPINELHARRTNPVMPALNPTTQDELMDMIFKEIFLETFMENGSEYFASIRFKHAGDPWITTIKALPFEVNKSIWPIPDAEIVNNTKMVQNPD